MIAAAAAVMTQNMDQKNKQIFASNNIIQKLASDGPKSATLMMTKVKEVV